MPKLMKGLGVSLAGQAAMEWQQFERQGMHGLQYGTPRRQALTVTKPLAALGLTIAGVAGVVSLVKRLTRG